MVLINMHSDWMPTALSDNCLCESFENEQAALHLLFNNPDLAVTRRPFQQDCPLSLL